MKRSCLSLLLVLLVAGCAGTATPPTPQAASPSSAVASPIAAASPTASAPSTPTGPVTITYLTGVAEDPTIEAKQEEEVAEFNASHPDIQVKREALDLDQLRTIIQTRLGPGDVDILDYDTGPGFGGVLAKAGLVADMKPFYDKYGWTFFDWAKSRCTYAGILTCVPHQVEELGIFYNKKMFAENGLTVPTTLNEFEATMDALKAKGIVPLAFGDQPQWPAYHQFSMVLSNILGRAGMDSQLYGDKPWNSPETVKAIDLFFKRFLEKGYFPKAPNAVTYEDANALFYAGKAAMIPTGTWLVGEISDKTKGKFDVGFFPFPSIDGSSVSPPSGLGSGAFLAKNSKHPDQAAVFLDWLQQPEQIKKWDLQTFNTIPAQPVDTSGIDVPELFETVLADLAATSGTTPEFGYNIDVLTPANFNDVMSTGFQQVLNGKLSPQQMADKLEAAYKVAMEKGDTIQRP